MQGYLTYLQYTTNKQVSTREGERTQQSVAKLCVDVVTDHLLCQVPLKLLGGVQGLLAETSVCRHACIHVPKHMCTQYERVSLVSSEEEIEPLCPVSDSASKDWIDISLADFSM